MPNRLNMLKNVCFAAASSSQLQGFFGRSIVGNAPFSEAIAASHLAREAGIRRCLHQITAQEWAIGAFVAFNLNNFLTTMLCTRGTSHAVAIKLSSSLVSTLALFGAHVCIILKSGLESEPTEEQDIDDRLVMRML